MLKGRKLGILLSYLLMFLEVVSTIVLTPMILRYLGAGNFGVYKLVNSVTSYLLLLDLGVGNAVIRFVSKSRYDNDPLAGRKFLGAVTLFYLIVAFAVAILGVVIFFLFPSTFSNGLSPEEVLLGQKLIAISTATAAVTLGTSPYANSIIAYERFGVSKTPSVIQVLARGLLIALSLQQGFGAVGILTVNLLTTLACRGFYLFYVLFKLRFVPTFRNLSFGFVKEIAVYSFFILLQMVATHINQTMDQILIGAMITGSAALVGVYGIAAQINQYFITIGSAMTGVLMPGLVKLMSRNPRPGDVEKEMTRIGRMILLPLVLIFVGFLICGRGFICLWVGDDFSIAYPVALILMAPQLVIMALNPGSQVLWATNKHKEISIIKLLVVLANVFTSIALIHWNPLLGAALGTSLSLLCGDVVATLAVFKRKLHISVRHYLSGLFGSYVLCSCFVAPMSFGTLRMLPLEEGSLNFLLAGISIVTAVYAFAVLISLRNEERSYFLHFFRALKRKKEQGN